MISLRSLFIASLLGLSSFAAQANIIEINYTGRIYDVNGDGDRLGLWEGDHHEGTFFIDLSLSSGDQWPEYNRSFFWDSQEGPGFIKRAGEPQLKRTSDYAYIYNNSNPDNQDEAHFSHSASDDYWYEDFALNLRMGDLDWIHNQYLSNTFFFTTNSEYLSTSIGLFTRLDQISETKILGAAAKLKLESLQINSVELPEPTAALLALIGLAALLMRRHITAQRPRSGKAL